MIDREKNRPKKQFWNDTPDPNLLDRRRDVWPGDRLYNHKCVRIYPYKSRDYFIGLAPPDLIRPPARPRKRKEWYKPVETPLEPCIFDLVPGDPVG